MSSHDADTSDAIRVADDPGEVRPSRRSMLKLIGAGAGAAGSLPALGANVFAQHEHHAARRPAEQPAAAKTPALEFFTPAEAAAVASLAEIIIPADDRSPSAREAGVAGFIDLMVSASPAETRRLWRDGLAALDRASRDRFAQPLGEATTAQQTALLTEISRAERDPMTIEERFFRALKSLTIDGYYTSEIGINQELRYQGNAYLKEFKGCAHPEHLASPAPAAPASAVAQHEHVRR